MLIFSHLALSPRDMFVLRRVNSFWKNVLEREVLTLRFFPKETVEMKTLLIAAHSFPNLRHLHLGYITLSGNHVGRFEEVCASLGKLTSLDVTKVDGFLFETLSPALLKLLNLTELNVSFLRAQSWVSAVPHLKHLRTLIALGGDEENEIATALQALKRSEHRPHSIVKLDLSGHRHFSVLVNKIAALEDLTDLAISVPKKLNRLDAALSFNMDPLFEIPNLTALNIAGLKFSPDSVANVAMCANLKRINLSRCPSITPELLNALGSHEGFEALDMSAAQIEGPSIAPSLVVFNQLKKLDLANTRIQAYAIDVRLFEAIRDMHLLDELNLLNWTFTEEQIFIALSNKLRLHTAVIRGYIASLMRLPPLPSLTDLDASRLSINFEALATITSLTRLDLSNLGRDVGTFQEFHTLLPLTRLKTFILDLAGLCDGDLPVFLTGFPNLTELSVRQNDRISKSKWIALENRPGLDFRI